ncbi:MAG: hypothetical protein KC635_10755 [Myxococcales bacterium]|nr:hypothetical protein [Myxococcales bacterium]MCB9737293.1 hypothetical protein [Deltaproteobacteria bacterium]
MPDLSPRELELVALAREKCRVLYEGVRTPHRSCGIALAETFGLPTRPYQALRRGGVTGAGECGAIVAGRLVLGELLGDPDPTAPVTPALVDAMAEYEGLWRERVSRRDAPGSDVVCNTLTGQFVQFRSAERHGFCTDLATEVATCVAEVLARRGLLGEVAPIEGLTDDAADGGAR